MAMKSFWHSKEQIETFRARVSQARNDVERHRIAAHCLIDVMLENKKITWQECEQMKREWDEQHGY